MPAKPSDQKSGLWGWLTRHWKMIRRVLMFIFVAAVIVLLVTLAREVEWDEVLAAMKQTKPMVLAMAIGLTCASYLIYSTYDLLGRIYAKHDLSNWRVMLICAISYAFNLSLGSFVGGMGFRYRLYSRHGLSAAKTTRILGLSLATNWMGYFLLGGALFASGKVTMPKGWEVGTGALQLIGVGLMIIALGYLAACAFSPRRDWDIKGHKISLPSGRLAAVTLVLGVSSWLVIGGIIWVLLEQKVDFFLVLGVFMLSGIAGAFAHIPGGLGVIEAVFVAMLSSKMPTSQILGALVVYRAVYYLAPLAIATVAYIGLEASLKKSGKGGATSEEKDEALASS
ncbi:MAG: lysylphosphatidylglycerol synthase domain-containing protein [Burkholderiaceae bacterium]